MIEVGTKLWYVPSQRHAHQTELKVTKVGRRWAGTVRGDTRYEFAGPRIDLKTLRADGGQYASPGQAYLSREKYEAETQRGNLWREFQRRLSVSPPAGLSEERIREMAFDCGITLSPPIVEPMSNR